MILQAEIKQSGKAACGIVVPAEFVEALGAGKKPKVKASVNGYTYRSSIGTMGGTFMLSVSAEVREKSGVKAGDVADFDIEVDREERVLELPDDFASALANDPLAKFAYDALSYSRQQRVVLPILALKGEEARARKVLKALQDLKDGKA